MQKLRRYFEEIAFAFRSSGPFFGSVLAANTIRFHALNFLKGRGAGPAHHYRIRLNGTPHNVWLRTKGGDLFIFYEVWMDACYRIPAAFLKKRTGLNILDLGANIGLTSLYFNSIFPDARIAVVEPNPSNLAVLRKNTENFRNIKVLPVAASATSGHVDFDDTQAAWKGAIMPEGKGSIQVRAMTLPQIMEGSGFDKVDILKMDIEGAEREILSGCGSWIDRVGMIAIELHGDYSNDRFQRDLQRSGFTVLSANSAYGNGVVMAVRDPSAPAALK